jgi:hypothetical protein
MMPEPDEKNIEDIDKDDRDALFRLITEEIKDLNEGDKLQGWTPWIMSATLISMVWLIVQDVWNNPVLATPTHAAFLVMSLAIWVILTVRGTFDAISPDQDGRKGPFLFMHTETTALSAFVATLWMGTIAIACLTIRMAEARYTLLIAAMCFSILAIFGLLMVLAIATRLPFPITMRRPFFFFVFSGIIGTICIAAIVNILKTDAIAVARINDIRAGGLLALGAYVLVLLSRGGISHQIVRKTLAELRRDILLGALPLDEARHRTRIALQGMWLSDVVRDDMTVLLKFISDVRALYDDAFRKIETLKASVPISSPSNAHLADFEKDAVSNTLDVLKTYEQRVSDISRQYFSRLRSVLFRIKLASRMVKAASPDQAKLLAEINLAQGLADAALERFVREFYEIQSAWNLWYPAEPRQHEPFNISISNISQIQNMVQMRRDSPKR